MADSTTPSVVREAISATCADICGECDADTDRETLIEMLDEHCDSLFGSLVGHGRIDQYDWRDLVATAQSCGAIIQVAEEDAWIEDDHGLWEGLTYGVLASIAYFSLRNCLYQALADRGHDSNDDLPFATVAGGAS